MGYFEIAIVVSLIHFHMSNMTLAASCERPNINLVSLPTDHVICLGSHRNTARMNHQWSCDFLISLAIALTVAHLAPDPLDCQRWAGGAIILQFSGHGNLCSAPLESI